MFNLNSLLVTVSSKACYSNARLEIRDYTRFGGSIIVLIFLLNINTIIEIFKDGGFNVINNI